MNFTAFLPYSLAVFISSFFLPKTDVFEHVRWSEHVLFGTESTTPAVDSGYPSQNRPSDRRLFSGTLSQKTAVIELFVRRLLRDGHVPDCQENKASGCCQQRHQNKRSKQFRYHNAFPLYLGMLQTPPRSMFLTTLRASPSRHPFRGDKNLVPRIEMYHKVDLLLHNAA